MRKSTPVQAILSLAILSLAEVSTKGALVVIDNFSVIYGAPDTPTMVVNNSDPQDTSSTVITSAGIANVTRSATLDYTGSHPTQVVTSNISGSSVSFNNSPDTTATLTLSYTFPNGSPANLMGVLNNVIILEFLSSDNPPQSATLDLAFTSVGGGSASVSLDTAFPAQVFPTSRVTPMASWAGVNFSQISNVTLTWKGGLAYDGDLNVLGADFVGAVPEPSTSLLLAGALLGFVSRRRRPIHS